MQATFTEINILKKMTHFDIEDEENDIESIFFLTAMVLT